MSESASKAVFLSYASQDAEAARRICDALRSGGVEVWFDADGGLEHGDEWDAKIRRQIKECVLFIPVISVNTQARHEGYFRLEWELAAQRAMSIASGVPFILPVVIDDTKEPAALVPDRFRAVQWTRLCGGEVPPEVQQRFLKLWSHRTGVLKHQTGQMRSVEPDGEALGTAPSRKARGNPIATWIAACVTIAAVIGFIALRPKPAVDSAARAPTVPRESGSSAELADIHRHLTPQSWTQADYEVMRPALDRFLQAHADNAEALALRSIVSTMQVLRTVDYGTPVLRAGKDDAERALRTSPGLPLGELALGLHYVAMTSRGGDVEEARPHIERALAALPRDDLTRYAELALFAWGVQLDRLKAAAETQLRENPSAMFPHWGLALVAFMQRRPEEAELQARQVPAGDPSAVRSSVTLSETQFYLRGDPAAARVAIERVPAEVRSHHRVIYTRWLLALVERRYDDAILELSRTPDPVLYDQVFHGPKALLAGIAHLVRGQKSTAAAQFQEAERALRSLLSSDADDKELRLALALTLAYAGRAADARSELAAVEPLIRGRAPYFYIGRCWEMIAETYTVLGDVDAAQPWLRLLLSKPSVVPYSTASLRLDPRFESLMSDARVEALLSEYASRNDTKADDKAVAVLPFANLSGDKEQEYFSDGLTEEILNALARERDLRVPGRTSSFSFKGKNASAVEIAKALNVSRLVEGSVQRSGTKVRIRVSLTRVADNASEELGTFTEELADIFALQDKVAHAVVEKLTHRQPVSSTELLTKNPAAFDAYLKGRALQTISANKAPEAAKFYARAVALDDGFALAWARLAEARFRGFSGNVDRSPEVVEDSRSAIDRALSIRPEFPEALIVRANWLRSIRFDFGAAERDLARAESMQPPTAELRIAQAILARDEGNWPEFFRLAQAALNLDPQNGDNLNLVGLMHEIRGHFAEADRLFLQAMAIQGPSTSIPFTNRISTRMVWRGPAAAMRLVDRAPIGQSGIERTRVELLLELGLVEQAQSVIRKFDPALSDGRDTPSTSSVEFEPRTLFAAGFEEEARKRAAELRPRWQKEFERGNVARSVFQELVSVAALLGERESAALMLENWRREASRDPSVYRSLFEFSDRAVTCYEQVGKVDEAIALLRQLETNGYVYLNQYAFRGKRDPRVREFFQRQLAWAAKQPDPIDP